MDVPPSFMSLLSSFQSGCRIVVVGASGGIGNAFVRSLASDSNTSQVFAFSRSSQHFDNESVTSGSIDISNEESIARCAAVATQDGPLDLVIIATGLLWDGDDLQPEKSMRELQHQNLYRAFEINAAGPAMVAKHFLPHLSKGRKSVFAALSARVGSIGDNRLGGWYAYRASKAALNMLLKTLSIEHARLWPKSIIVGLHPGTVDTGLSEPYTQRTPAEKLFTPEMAAGYLIRVIDRVQPVDSGNVIAWDGVLVEN